MEKALQRMRISVKTIIAQSWLRLLYYFTQQNNFSQHCTINFRSRTISAKIVLLIFAIEQFRPRLCYQFSQQNNLGQDCAINFHNRTISAEIVLLIFAIEQSRPRLCYIFSQQNNFGRDCDISFRDNTEQYQNMLTTRNIDYLDNTSK